SRVHAAPRVLPGSRDYDRGRSRPGRWYANSRRQCRPPPEARVIRPAPPSRYPAEHRIRFGTKGITMRGRVPLRMRIVTKLRPAPDWDSVTPEQFVEFRTTQNRLRGSRLLRPLTGRPDRAARIADEPFDLPGRRLNIRVYRPEWEGSPLPMVIAFHGGGLISGFPDQDD